MQAPTMLHKTEDIMENSNVNNKSGGWALPAGYYGADCKLKLQTSKCI